MKKINIAIDGFSSTGKSTLARQLADKLGYTYVDSGAMYRAITFYFIQHHIDLHSNNDVAEALNQIHLTFQDNIICLNGMPIESEIRGMEISSKVSEVAALEAVRIFAVRQQQMMGAQKGVVMDGRDIGTTVFPDAELKIFLTANESVRSQRRYDELKDKQSDISLEDIQSNLKHRDHIDSTREHSPLRKAHDAVELDNTHYSMSEQLDIAYQWAMECINRTN
ncbi:MAG: (d)CMP kinase [Chitinophagaceae bacterium]|nr:(d)CMP kinase [Chitinophagaceae bacterium]